MLFSCSTAGSWTREQSSSLPVLESSSLVLVSRQCSCSEEGCKRGEFYQELMVYTGDVRIHNFYAQQWLKITLSVGVVALFGVNIASGYFAMLVS